MDTDIHVVNNILITGGTSGLGLELVKYFLSEGYDVFTTGRDPKSIRFSNQRFHFIEVDFSDLSRVSEEIYHLTKQTISFDIIINNAGILSPPVYTKTKNGFEHTFQVNFLSHLLIDEIILSNSKNTMLPLIVSITSPVYSWVKEVPDFNFDRSEYKAFKSYAISKFSLALMGIHLAEKYKKDRLRCFSFNPGTFSSGIYRMQNSWFQNMYRIASPFMRNPSKVAQILAEIIQQQKIFNGAVYRSKNSFKTMDYIDKETIDEFMTESYSKIQSYLR
jgi:NAD(P)-dependent dehydrogenase (short-subunit alcohol dehydrogenase family)